MTGIDFSQINNADIIEERELILAEQNAREELAEMADLLEAKDVDGEFEELIENARFTAEQNALSETAVDLREELMTALQECR